MITFGSIYHIQRYLKQIIALLQCLKKLFTFMSSVQRNSLIRHLLITLLQLQLHWKIDFSSFTSPRFFLQMILYFISLIFPYNKTISSFPQLIHTRHNLLECHSEVHIEDGVDNRIQGRIDVP